MTQQNAALVEQVTAAAQSMQDQAIILSWAVSVFKLHGMHGNARPHADAPTSHRAQASAATQAP